MIFLTIFNDINKNTLKEDLQRLCTFERLIPILEKEKPEVLKAWNDYKASKKILDIVIDSLF